MVQCRRSSRAVARDRQRGGRLQPRLLAQPQLRPAGGRAETCQWPWPPLPPRRRQWPSGMPCFTFSVSISAGVISDRVLGSCMSGCAGQDQHGNRMTAVKTGLIDAFPAGAGVTTVAVAAGAARRSARRRLPGGGVFATILAATTVLAADARGSGARLPAHPGVDCLRRRQRARLPLAALQGRRRQPVGVFFVCASCTETDFLHLLYRK